MTLSIYDKVTNILFHSIYNYKAISVPILNNYRKEMYIA